MLHGHSHSLLSPFFCFSFSLSPPPTFFLFLVAFLRPYGHHLCFYVSTLSLLRLIVTDVLREPKSSTDKCDCPRALVCIFIFQNKQQEAKHISKANFTFPEGRISPRHLTSLLHLSPNAPLSFNSVVQGQNGLVENWLPCPIQVLEEWKFSKKVTHTVKQALISSNFMLNHK